MSEDYEFVTRTAKNQRRKANNSGVKKITDRILNILIVIVAILIVISLVLIVTNDDLKSDIMNSNSKEQNEEADTSQSISELQNQENEGGQANNQYSSPTEDTAEGEVDLNHITFVPSNDSNVIQSWVNKQWTPYPTQQTGTHESAFDEGHIDYQEKVKLIYRDTEFTEDDSIIWSIKNASGDAVAVFSTLNQSEVYRLTMTWIDGEGWQTTLIQQLKSLEGAY
jgi:cell division protein FtsL